jgi:hypothetical protein
MSDDIKRMPIKEFRDLGFIQEINRQLLHPCGLALEVIVDLETGEEKLGGVWDYRDDPEGIRFLEIDEDKKRRVRELFEAKAEWRQANLDYIVQEVSEE